MGHVIIGMDPHNRSTTIEVTGAREKVLAQGRFGTDRDGYKTMLAAGRGFPDRTWAVAGCGGIGRHIAQRLIAPGRRAFCRRRRVAHRWPAGGCRRRRDCRAAAAG